MKIGMVGGIGPESTVEYYRLLIKLYQRHADAGHYPELVINSIDMTAMLELVAGEDWEGLAAMLLHAVGELKNAGASLAFIASNTPHVVFGRMAASPLPLVSIVEAAREEAQRRSCNKVGLLGTLFTMRSSYYREEFEKAGITVVTPNEREREYIQHKLFSEIEQGLFLEETRNGLLKITQRLRDEEGIDGVVLGCTELPLILTGDEYGVPFLNTTAIHAERVFSRFLALREAKRA